MKRTIFSLVATMLCGAAIVACSEPSQSPKSSIPTTTKPAVVEGLHIYDTRCGDSKDAKGPSQIQVGTVRGTLRLEQSTTDQECRYAYWGKFQPDALSKGSFAVTIQADQGTLYSTSSDSLAGSDKLYPDVKSLVVDGSSKHTVQACVTVGSDVTKQCLTATVS